MNDYPPDSFDPEKRDSVRKMQHDVISLLSPLLEETGFVLGGSGAIREHGIIDRPTEDIDMITAIRYQQVFNTGLDTALRALTQNGYAIKTIVPADIQPFARLILTKDGVSTGIDFAIMARHYTPEALPIGNVLALPDAIGSKLNAAATRATPRDYLDAIMIHENTTYTTEQLITMAKKYDHGFKPEQLSKKLHQWNDKSPKFFEPYMPIRDAIKIQINGMQWADEIDTMSNPPQAQTNTTQAGI